MRAQLIITAFVRPHLQLPPLLSEAIPSSQYSFASHPFLHTNLSLYLLSFDSLLSHRICDTDLDPRLPMASMYSELTSISSCDYRVSFYFKLLISLNTSKLKYKGRLKQV